jgi:CO/xanthine dehydrogenase Mo-binding subunit
VSILAPGTARGIGERVPRSDGRAKVTGAFAYSSDLHVDGMLFGATLRSPHPAARILGMDPRAALAATGVRAVLTHEDVPGDKLVGSVLPDQPVLAIDRVRYHGEPVALVAADDPEAARAAARRIAVDYEPGEAVTDARAALEPGAIPVHAGGNDLRTVPIVHGDPGATGAVTVRGTYEVGRQDQAFLGPESGLAVPDGEGGVDLHVSTQFLHVDRDQVAAGLGLAPEQVRVHLAGVGGAFGAREDLSMQLHACMLALATGRPVKMVYSREESFLGHVHRHPAFMDYEHVAGEDGRLLAVRLRLILDGGAYASSSTAVIANAATLACGPYAVPNARIEATVAYTNNPSSGAMRGFGAVQVAVGYEAQMDRLAERLGLDPVELRIRNALPEGGELPTGQAVRGPVAIPELLERLVALPVPERGDDPLALPGGAFRPGDGAGVVRAVGYAAGIKNIAFSEGYDDPATARVRVERSGGRLSATVYTAATEVGQGVLGVQEQIVRSELGIDDVRVRTADTRIAPAGSASASRLTWIAGGAVQAACRALAPDVEGIPEGGALETERTYRHGPTKPLDPVTGQGDSHAGFAFVAHRAVVDVDVELGLARVVELACAQDVGLAVNPLALEGQLHGGSIQGLGLALTEELVTEGGVVQTLGFGAYRIPTMMDAPPVPTIVLELGNPDAPYGLRGAGEMPSISSTPAIVAALRTATGRELRRVPVRPEDLAG